MLPGSLHPALADVALPYHLLAVMSTLLYLGGRRDPQGPGRSSAGGQGSVQDKDGVAGRVSN